MDFKVGDRVRIREDLSCDEEYPLVEFISTMEKFKGKEAIIINVDFCQEMYLINLDNGEHWWVAEMLEPIVMHDRPKEKSLLTEDERAILRNLDKEWKWIARDEDGNLHIFSKKPEKEVDEWDVFGIMNYAIFYMFNDIFQFIKWEDDEPYNIEELLKGECGNESVDC